MSRGSEGTPGTVMGEYVMKKPMLPRDRVMVAVNRDEEYELRCAREYGVGAEVQMFALPEVLSGDFVGDLGRVAAAVSGLAGPIGCHGPFIDTCHYSTDPEVMKVSRMRYLQALEIAEVLGAGYVLFHSQYNTMLRLESFPGIYHEQSMRFWPGILEEAENRGLSIYIENMFDETPEALRRLADAISSPRFKLCMDVAHCELHSELSLAEWVDGYGPHLRHVHLNDCRGRFDDHLGLGQGSLDLVRALELLRGTGLALTYALETNAHTEASLRFLGFDRIG